MMICFEHFEHFVEVLIPGDSVVFGISIHEGPGWGVLYVPSDCFADYGDCGG